MVMSRVCRVQAPVSKTGGFADRTGQLAAIDLARERQRRSLFPIRAIGRLPHRRYGSAGRVVEAAFIHPTLMAQTSIGRPFATVFTVTGFGLADRPRHALNRVGELVAVHVGCTAFPKFR